MESTNLYIALEQSTLVSSKKVHIEDIATLFCLDADISYDVKKTVLFTFSDNEQEQSVITILKLIEVISTKHKNVTVVSIGCPETIVYYRNLNQAHKLNGKLKAFFLMLLAFFGTAYSIMSYNGDVGSIDLLSDLYTMFTGNTDASSQPGFSLGIVVYSIGLAMGMIIFFNHGLNRKKTDDPTPLQVQMRLYENDVNQTIIVNSERNNETIDVN